MTAAPPVDVRDLPLEAVPCLLCGSADAAVEARTRDYEYAVTAQTFTILRCTRCRHLYLSPRPRLEAAARLYPPTYYTQSESHVHGGFGLLGRLKEAVTLRRCQSLVSALPPSAAVLEAGCGDGALLRAVRKLRPDLALMGVDLAMTPSQEAALGALAIATMRGPIETATFAAGSFDLIVMNQVLEHLWDPRGTLTRMHGWLRPGGRISIATPNADGYDRRWFRDGAWGGYYAPRHFNLFTADSLARVLIESGFQTPVVAPLTAPLVWVRNFLYLWKARGWPAAGLFADENLPLLAAFAAADAAASWCGWPTSNQQAIATR